MAATSHQSTRHDSLSRGVECQLPDTAGTNTDAAEHQSRHGVDDEDDARARAGVYPATAWAPCRTSKRGPVESAGGHRIESPQLHALLSWSGCFLAICSFVVLSLAVLLALHDVLENIPPPLPSQVGQHDLVACERREDDVGVARVELGRRERRVEADRP